MKTKKVVQVFLLGAMIMFLGLLLGGRIGLFLGLALSLLVFWLSLQDETLFLIKKSPHRLIKGQDLFGFSQFVNSEIFLIESDEALICSGTTWGSKFGWIAITEKLVEKVKKEELIALLQFHDRWVSHRNGYWTRLSSGIYCSIQNFIYSSAAHHVISKVGTILFSWLTLLPGKRKYIAAAVEETPTAQKEVLARSFERLKSYAVNIPTSTPSSLDFLFVHPQRPCRQLSNPYIRQLVGYEPL